MKTVLIFITAISLTVTAAGQHISIGPTAGFGHSWLTLENAPAGYDNSFHPAYNFGAKLVYSIETYWGLSADVKFSGEGGKLSNNNNDLVYRANYIRVPLQGIYFFGDYGQAVRPKISLGPSFGFLTGGKYKTRVNEQTQSEGDIKNIFTGFDVGLNAAVGANIRVAPATWLNTDITYYHGFSDVSETNNSVRNRNIGINVGLLFGLSTSK